MGDRGDSFDRRDFGARSGVPSQREEAYDYVVKTGDTLSALAETWLGSPARWPEVVRANPGRISDPDRIRPGLRLLIPASGGRVVSGVPLPRDERRDRIYLTYLNLPRVERMSFWKLLDEVEQPFTKAEVAKEAKLDWLKKGGVPLPLNDAPALYRAYARLGVADRTAVAAAIQKAETEFGLAEVNAHQPERKITADELLPNWRGSVEP